MYPEDINNDAINDLPLLTFGGRIVVVSDPGKAAESFRELKDMEWVGFDTETRPNFKKGVIHPISLFQIAIEKKVFIFRILSMGLVEAMINFFESDVKKVGIALHDDIKGLQREKTFQPNNFINLGDITGELGIKNKGLRKLSGIILGKRISKGQQLSNWENETLTDAQIQYAALDAWACWKMYTELKSKGLA